MILKINQLKQFRNVASFIKSNGIIPINSYLKFDNGKITKSNSESFVTFDADFKGALLIDERVLFSFIERAGKDEIVVTQKGSSVLITDGKLKVTSPTDKPELFTVPDIDIENKTEIGAKVLYAVKSALNFTVENPANPFTECVFIGNGLVAASDSFTAYTEPVAEGLPEIVLSRTTAQAITKYETVLYSENESYQFFTIPGTAYGFGKKSVKFVSMVPHSRLPEGEKHTLNKKEFIDFCETCIASTPAGAVLNAQLLRNILIMKYPAYEIDVEMPISLPLTETMNDFCFNPVLFLRTLKALPDQEITFIHAPARYYMTGETGFVSLIMEMKL